MTCFLSSPLLRAALRISLGASLGVAAMLLGANARADSADDSSFEDGDTGDDDECSVDVECNDSGVLCGSSDANCQSQAEGSGKELRCEAQRGQVWCDPDEDDNGSDGGGCAIESPRRERGADLAWACFAVAAIGTGVRFARARSRR